jgi:hypothetical protein
VHCTSQIRRGWRVPSAATASEVGERKSAIGLCRIHKSLVAEGNSTAAAYTPAATEIATAMRAPRSEGAVSQWRCQPIEPEFRKALSSFFVWQ